MVVFCRIKIREGPNLGNYLVGVVIQFTNILLSLLLLFVTCVKNSGPILLANVSALSIKRCWVVNSKEGFKERTIRYYSRIKFYLYHLSVPGTPTGHLFVSRILNPAAAVSRYYFF